MLKIKPKDSLPIQFCKDFYNWPDSWMGFDEDIQTGDKIIEAFCILIESLVAKKLAKKTIVNHMNNLWVLGAEIIKSIHYDEAQRELSGNEIVLEYVDESGGPLVNQWNSGDSADMGSIKAFDATCKKLYKALVTSK